MHKLKAAILALALALGGCVESNPLAPEPESVVPFACRHVAVYMTVDVVTGGERTDSVLRLCYR